MRVCNLCDAHPLRPHQNAVCCRCRVQTSTDRHVQAAVETAAAVETDRARVWPAAEPMHGKPWWQCHQ